MSKSVFTGWRTIVPGTCDYCGYDDNWECNGSGVVYCNCCTCPGCGEPEGTGHGMGCPEARVPCQSRFSGFCDGYAIHPEEVCEHCQREAGNWQ